ncbi:MAG: glycosyltransferase family 4 protein [Tepidisphaeraceae bacterium]|jgi:glycosyltransferase involved in cell wall biosynthesis
MKINFILTNASMSGGTRVIVTQARELMARGHEVRAFSTPPKPPGFRKKLSSLLHGKGWPKTWGPGESFFDGSGVPHAAIPRFRPINNQDLPDADVVVATWWETAEWVWRLAPSKGAKAFFIQHYEIWGGDPKRVDAAWRLPLHKIVISRWLAQLARDKFGDADVSLVPNSVDMKLFNAPPRARQKRPTVGLLYNRLWFKGCDVALKAVEIALRQIPDLQLIAFGQDPLRHWLPLPPGAQYLIKPSQESIKNIYAQCDVWLCGSRAEGFHLPPLEAMACRCPVVSTRVGGPLDTIEDGKNGFLVNVEDPDALADRLVRILKLSDPQWQDMSDAAYATACRYTWQDAAALMETALQTAIERSSSARPIGA